MFTIIDNKYKNVLYTGLSLEERKPKLTTSSRFILTEDYATPPKVGSMKLDKDTIQALMEEDSVATIQPDATFASMPVFKVNNADFSKCKFGKSKFARWAKHIDVNSESGRRIYAYAKKNPNKSIIVQHEKSGHMLYLRKYSKTDGGKSGIMVKKGKK